MTPSVFFSAIGPAAKLSMESTHIPASFTMAEAALESSWGASQLTTDAMNLFGIKADPSWKGEVYNIKTREYENGQWIMVLAPFRKYADWLGSISDHAAFLIENERYKDCFLCKDGPSFAKAVAKAGYATDPDYAEKIIEIINAHDLETMDTVVVKTPVPTTAVPTPVTPPPVVEQYNFTTQAEPIPAPVPVPVVTPPAQQGGFMAWLKRFF